jgi:DNA polymerase-3 subunit beta
VTKGIGVPAGVLKDMIERVGFAITTEDPRYSLHGALLLVQGRIPHPRRHGRLPPRVRLRKGIAGKSGDIRVIVPRKALGEVGKLAAEVASEDTVTFGKSGNHVFFTVGDHTLTTTVPEGNFPNYEEVMPKRCETELLLATGEITDAVKRVVPVGERTDSAGPVAVHAVERRLELSSREPRWGRRTSPHRGLQRRRTRTIGFNARYPPGVPGRGRDGVRAARSRPRPRGRDRTQIARTRRPGDKPGQFRPEPPETSTTATS